MGVASRPPQHDVEAVAERPLRLGGVERERRDQAPAGWFCGNRIEDRIEGEQGIAGKVHLGHQPGQEAAAEHREVHVRRPPGILVVPPRIGARLDGQEPELADRVRQHAPGPGEVRVERRRVPVLRVRVPAGGIGLPDLDQRLGDRPAVLVENPAGDDDAFAERLAGVLPGQVVIRRPGIAVAVHRTGDLRERLRDDHQRAGRMPGGGGPVAGRVVRRVAARRRTSIPVNPGAGPALAVLRRGRFARGVRLPAAAHDCLPLPIFVLAVV